MGSRAAQPPLTPGDTPLRSNRDHTSGLRTTLHPDPVSTAAALAMANLPVLNCSPPNPEGLNLVAINATMTFTPAERFTVSCGTVTVDPPRRRVLLIFNRRLDIHQLPKGRKHLCEDLGAAALRETWEETGVRAVPLPLYIRTRATVPLGERDLGGKGRPERPAAEGGKSDPEVLADRAHTDFVGAVRYPDPQSRTPGTAKTIFYYAAVADSRAGGEGEGEGKEAAQQQQQLEEGAGALEPHERLRGCWVGFDEVMGLLRFQAERDAVWAVLRALDDAKAVNGVVPGSGGEV